MTLSEQILADFILFYAALTGGISVPSIKKNPFFLKKARNIVLESD